ncbi:MAG TPA: hypothetical protein VIC57_10175, partial [Candidatus Dormibacteraeota bacterium]
MNPTAAPRAPLTVLLVDDIELQASRIRDRLEPYRVRVEWRRSYGAAAELLRDPDAGPHVDLILIDQAFDVDAVPDEELLTPAEIEPAVGSQEWDVRLHQGLFVLARLQQDMREGVISFAPTMILAHDGRIGAASRTRGPSVYQTKRRLLADPYGTLRPHLPMLRPTEEDVDLRLGELARRLGLEGELAEEVRGEILAGTELEAACDALEALKDPNDWRAVGRALRSVAERDAEFPRERLAASLMGSWLASPMGWQRVCHVEELGPLDLGFLALRVWVGREADASQYPALLAARAFAAGTTPDFDDVRRGSSLLCAIDGRNRPFRLRSGRWTVLGCWLREPEEAALAVGPAVARLRTLTCHVRDLHARGLAHGLLTALSIGFEPPVFAGLRCLGGELDLDALRRDDLRRLPTLRHALFGEVPPPCAEEALDRWSTSVQAGDLDAGERALASACPCGERPAYFDSEQAYAGGERGFRDLLLASLGEHDAVLRDVRCEDGSAAQVSFVVCVGGALAVLDHRAHVARVRLAGGAIATVETASDRPDQGRLERSLARCRRTADALAARIERSSGLRPGSIRRLSAVVVDDETEVRSEPGADWRPVVTQTDAIVELRRLSSATGEPTGVDMARHLPRPVGESGSRALHWTAIPLDSNLVLRRTWRKRWRDESWRELMRRLIAATAVMLPLEDGRHPLPLTALRAYDDEGEARDVESEPESVERVEYGVRIPSSASPLASWFAEPGTQAGRRRMGAEVLRGLLSWERSPLAYVGMAPTGVVQADGRLYCDLLEAVVPADREARARQRRGAAACLVFLLSRYP